MSRYKKNIIVLLTILFIIVSQGCASNKNVQSKGLANFSESSSSEVQKVAFVVGVSDYAGDRADLGGIELDTDKMKRLFRSLGFDVKVLYDKESMQLLEYLDSYAQRLTPNDLFAFYYSGHGSHAQDLNGDEADNMDETLVLSDGKVNKHLIDDILFAKFNAIKAKKMVFFDSCYSGTVFRSLNGKVQAKTIRPEEVTERMSTSKGLAVAKSDTLDKNSGEYVVLSSSQDHEESLATPRGSLFTNALYEMFSSESGKNRSFNEVGEVLTRKVLAYASETDGKPHHPNINFSASSLGNRSLNQYIMTKSTPIVSTSEVVAPQQSISQTPAVAPPVNSLSEGTLQATLEGLITSRKFQSMKLHYDKTLYREGELVNFRLDTGSDRGYLTIFYVDGNDVTVLYPNPFVSTRVIHGEYSFPKDLSNGQFELEAYKSCKNCREEKTVIYTLLSREPIADVKQIQGKGLMSFSKESQESKIMSRAVRIKATSKTEVGFVPQLGKYSFTVK